MRCSSTKSLSTLSATVLLLSTSSSASTSQLHPRQASGAIGGIAQAAQGFIQGRQTTASGGNGAVITMR